MTTDKENQHWPRGNTDRSTACLEDPRRKRPLHAVSASQENTEKTVGAPLVGCGDLPAVNGQDTPTSHEPEKSLVDSLWASMRAGGRIPSRWDPRSTAFAEAAKEALQTDKLHDPHRCRVEEFVCIRRYLRKRLKHVRGGVMLLSGPSGTGKSVALQQAEKLVRCWISGSKPGSERPKSPRAHLHPPIVAHVNCVALPDLQRVRDRIIEEFRKYHGDLPPFAEVGPLASPDRMTVILLDGIDHLVSDALWEIARDALPRRAGYDSAVQELVNARELALSGVHPDGYGARLRAATRETLSQYNSTLRNETRCILVGVIKDEDLTRVAVSKFKNLGFEPNVIRFKAYDSDQLKLLLRVRLGCLPWTVFEWAGLEMCARKVAATTGDMHRALNICAAALDICVREANEAAKTEDRETASRRARKAASTSLVRISHMERAISLYYE